MYRDARKTIYDTFRDLWREHVVWAASYINSVVLGYGNAAYENQRIFENADNFQKELIKYYSNDDTIYFGVFLKAGLLYKTKYTVDYQKGFYDTLEIDKKEWVEAASNWAYHMSKMNPFWDFQQMQNMLYEHVNLTEQELLYELTHKAAGIDHVRATEEQEMIIADYMAEGLMRQFNL